MYLIRAWIALHGGPHALGYRDHRLYTGTPDGSLARPSGDGDSDRCVDEVVLPAIEHGEGRLLQVIPGLGPAVPILRLLGAALVPFPPHPLPLAPLFFFLFPAIRVLVHHVNFQNLLIHTFYQMTIEVVPDIWQQM